MGLFDRAPDPQADQVEAFLIASVVNDPTDPAIQAGSRKAA